VAWEYFRCKVVRSQAAAFGYARFTVWLAMVAKKNSAPLMKGSAYADEHALLIVKPEQLVLLFLFLQEVMRNGRKVDAQLKSIDFFLRRAGGMHLLLLLLNAHYNKRAVGRMPGWGFSVLRRRIRISERSLRLLVADALDMGLLTQLRGIRDRRVRVYCISPVVAHAWERLFSLLGEVLPEVFERWGPARIADIEFGSG
jgi:hypothetical protein